MTYRFKLTDEQRRKAREYLKANPGTYRMVPCGPPCDVCGDNSYDCECREGAELMPIEFKVLIVASLLVSAAGFGLAYHAYISF